MSGGMSDEALRTKVRLRQEAVARRDMEEETIKAFSEELGAELCLRAIKSQQVDEWTVALVDQDRERLDKQALVEAGVTAEQLQKATRVTRTSSVQVRRRGHGQAQ